MIEAIELQVISRILTSDSKEEIDILCNFGTEYYSVYREHIEYILNHQHEYGDVPDVFTFQAQFPDVTLVKVSEPTEYLIQGLNKNRQQILLVETFNKLKNLGSGDVTDAWKYLSMQCDKVAELDSSDPMDIIKDAKERSEQIIEFSKQARIPTGFAEIDKLMYGGLSTVEELLLIVARTNSGKAQPLWSKVLTPKGWVTMGELKLGDTVIGENNDKGQVVQIFPQGVKDYYRVNFNDGTYVECCDDHLWKVLDTTRRIRASKLYECFNILTLKDIRTSLSNRYSVDISEPVEFESDFDVDAELDAYLLGLLLGDGGTRDGRVLLSSENREIWSYVENTISKYNCYRSGSNKDCIKCDKHNGNFVRNKLKEYGLLRLKSIDKFIPKLYLKAPVEVRKALLAGLVDTDGYISASSKQVWEFDTSSERLAEDFAELARSLGVRVTVSSRSDSYYTNNGVKVKAHGTRHLVCRSIFNPFRVSEKASRYACRTTPYNGTMPKRHCKMIESVEYVGQTECQCILLNNKSHTYITDGYTVTHNSWVCTKMMESSQKNGFPVLYYSPEMQASYLGTRFDTWRAHFQNSQLYQGKYTPQYIEYIENLEKESTSAFILEDKDVAGGAVNTRVIEQIVKKHKIKLVIIDGLSYMEDSKKATSDYERYKNLCLDLFRLSKKYSCAVVVAMQANRETKENKDDKGLPFPGLGNVEGSDHPGRIATQAFALRQIFDKHVLDIRLEKSRIANNQKPVLSYAWDVNTGNMQYLPGGEDDPVASVIAPTVVTPKIITHTSDNAVELDEDDFDSDDVEF